MEIEFTKEPTFYEAESAWEVIDKAGGMEFEIQIYAEEKGPHDQQITRLKGFLENHKEVLDKVKRNAFEELGNKKVIDDSFCLSAVWLFPEEENFSLGLSGRMEIRGILF